KLEAVVVRGWRTQACEDGKWAVGDRAGRRGACGRPRAAANARGRQRLIVLEAAVAGGKVRVGVAILPRLVVPGHRERGFGHRQLSVDERERVVGRSQRALGGGDGVRAAGYRTGRERGGGQARSAGHARGRQRFTVLDASDGGGEGGVGVTVLARLVIGGHRQQRLADRQVRPHITKGVVRVKGQRPLLDGIHTHVLAGEPGEAAAEG